MGALVVVMVLVLVGGIAVVAVLRSMGLEELRIEARLHDPRAHTVSYAVPEGVDPAVLLTALRTSGFTGVVEDAGLSERLLVGCEEVDRPRLRTVLEAVPLTRYDGTPLRSAVVFEDER